LPSLEDFDFIEIEEPEEQINRLRQAVPEFDWDRYEVREPESFSQKVKRGAAQGASRIAEGALGAIGDVQQFAGDIAGAGIKKLTGKEGTGVEMFIKGEHPLQKKPGVHQALLGHRFPTSEDIEENVTEPLFGELQNPRLPTSQWTNSLIKDVSSLLGGGSKLSTALLGGLGGAVAESGAKELGLSPGKQAGAKIGGLVLGSLLRPGSVKAKRDLLYKEADALLPRGAMTSSQNLMNELSSLRADLVKGGGSKVPANKKIIDFIDELQKSNQGALIPVDELLAAKRNLNAIAKDPESLKGAEKLIGKVQSEVNTAIENYGKQSNKKFLKKFREADLLHASMNQRNRAADFISRHLNYKGLPPASMVLLSYLTMGPKIASGLAGAGIGAAGLRQGAKLLKNPAIRKHYMQTIVAATKEDAAALKNALDDLNGAVEEETSKRKKQREKTGRYGRTGSAPKGALW